jgi:AraC-like DNA-binding protein
MIYASGEERIAVPQSRIMLFWAAIAHRVTEVHGSGKIICVNVSLQEFCHWNLPTGFRHQVMHGGFVVTLGKDESDRVAFKRWRQDCEKEEPRFRRQALDEIQLRIRRMALTGWRLASNEHAPARSASAPVSRRLANTEAMASYIAEHYQEPIGVEQVSVHVGLHPNYATTLFKQVLGMSISTYLTRHRLSHAQAMLLDTDSKILTVAMECGFGSLSRFYKVFRNHLKTTPRQYREARRLP